MSEDQKHERGPGQGADGDSSAFTESLGAGEPERIERPTVDPEAIAKHRAAKEARIRKRLDAKRQASESGSLMPRDGGPNTKGPKTGKGSALPALRPELKADTPALRAERVEAIRRDLVRRRRRKGGGMLLKLWLAVVLPTSIVAWFMWFEASEFYRSEAQFLVQSADRNGGASSGGLLGLIGGGGGAYDPNAVQSYLLSRDVLRLLDREHGWIAHFQQPGLDFFHGLAPEATFEDAYRHYQDMIEVSYDPTEGLVEMSLVAADPLTARRFSEAVVGYAEEMVNRLSARIQADAVEDAELNLVESEERLRQAEQSVAELQKALDTFTVEGEVVAEMQIIGAMEVELEALRGRRTNLLRVTDTTDARVERISNQILTLESQIAQRREKITGESTEDRSSLADINLAMTKARFEVEAASAIFAAAVQRREVAVANARRQGRYLEMVSSPSMPDEANYPQKIETTALAFFAFLGFYIIASLTISLIREQASI